MSNKGTGILGGTFDPIHNGHLQLALGVYKALNLQTIRFIPAAHPLLRTAPSANTQDRLDMVRLAIAPYDFFQVDEREIKRGGQSYMIDTLAEIRAEQPNVPLYLILGVDQFSKFDQWKDWGKIPSLAHIIVSTREGCEFSPHQKLHQFISRYQTKQLEPMQHSLSGSLFFLTQPTLPISSTEIREKCEQNEDVASLLPQKVWEYICQKRLYGIG